MTRKELMALRDGTLIYNGHAEGMIRTDSGVKCIEILIPITGMNDHSRHFDEKPEYWDLMDD